MLEQHKSHLVSTYTTIMQHLAEIQQVAATGKTPSGELASPLQEPLRAALLARLDALDASLAGMIGALVPDWNKARSEGDETGRARMWVNILLRTIEELMQDLLPDNMGRQYGALDSLQVNDLQSRVEDALRLLHEIMQLSDQGGKRRADQS